MKGRAWFGGKMLTVNRYYVRKFEVAMSSTGMIYIEYYLQNAM